MKKIFSFILLIFFGFGLIGCAKIDFGFPNNLNPKEKNEDLPTSVVVESVNNNHKLFVSETLQLKATVYPETVNETVIFSSNNKDIATVDQSGLVTGVSEGMVKITAKVSKRIKLGETTTVEGYIYLTVLESPIATESVEIVGDANIYVDEIIKYDLEKTPANANYIGTWSTSDESIITVDQNGRVKAINLGVAVVTYKVNDEIFSSKTINVVERNHTPTSIEIIVRNEIEVKETVKAYIDVKPRGSINSVDWISSNDEIATIDNLGNVTAHKAGIVTITAKVNETITDSVEVKIIDNQINQEQLEQNLVDLVRTRKQAIFGVSNYQIDDEGDLIRKSIGSGFVYKVEFILKDGSRIFDLDEIRTFSEVDYFKYYLITNRHVVEGSDELRIYMRELDKEITSSLIQYDDKVDLAIVTFNFNKYIKPLKLANSDKLEAGRFAVAIGNPNGYEFSYTATFGIVSHPKRFLATDTNNDGVNDWDAEYIQHDVAINPGNSGGPLFNLAGEVIGVNTLKYVSREIEGMGFSVPSNVVASLIPYLENGEKPIRATIGITAIAVKDVLQNPKSEIAIPEGIDFGLYVVSLVENSVAKIGGILEDDIIIKFNNVELSNVLNLRAELNQIIVGSNTEIEVIVYRNNEYVTLNLIF